MFFIFSKILSFASSPFFWILSFLTIGVFTKDLKKRKKYILISFVLFIIFSNNFILSVAKSTIEEKPIFISKLKQNYDFGIVLGGFAGFDKTVKRIQFHESSDRLWQAIFLYKKRIIKKIVISGGSGKVFNNKVKEANIVKKYLIDIGIKENDIIIESKSRNTYENALYTSRMEEIKKGNAILLITSSLHIYRAKKCFEKQEINVDVFPTNYYSMKDANFFDYIIPNSGTLFKWNEFLHEILGIIAYKISGKI